VRTPEDVAFYRALVRVNARFRHSPMVRAVTSARQTGRTNMGLANQLSEWAVMGRQSQPFLVESAAAIETRLRTRYGLRMLWWRMLNGYQPTKSDVAPLANNLGVATVWLTHELTLPHTFGLLLERIEQRQQEEGVWLKRWPLVDIKQAIYDLRLQLERLRYARNHQQRKERFYQSERDSLHPKTGVCAKPARISQADTVPRADLLDDAV